MSITDKAILAERNRAIIAQIEAQPNVQRMPTRNIDVYTCRNFLDGKECQLLVDKIDRDARPSTLLSSTDDTEFRTSSSTDFNRQEPAIDRIEEKITRFMGIPKENGETIQGQRYEVGQQFKRLGKMFHAEKGKLLCWNNLTHEGEPNEWSLHQGMKVRKGVKYIITKWFRETAWAQGSKPSQY